MLPCSRGSNSSQQSLCYCIYPLIRLIAARPCVRLRVISVARPGSASWRYQSADVRRRRRGCKVFFVSMHQMLHVFHCNNKKSHGLSTFQTHSVFLGGFQRTAACPTVNPRSLHLVATARLAQPPPRAQRGHARPRVHDSHSSGPPRSMLSSWGPTDRDSTRESYVSSGISA